MADEAVLARSLHTHRTLRSALGRFALVAHLGASIAMVTACGAEPESASVIPGDRKARFEAAWDLETRLLPYKTRVSTAKASVIDRAWDGSTAYYQILAPHERPDGMKAYGLVTGELRWSEPSQEWFWMTNHHLVTVGTTPRKSQGTEVISKLIDMVAWPNREEALSWPTDNLVTTVSQVESKSAPVPDKPMSTTGEPGHAQADSVSEESIVLARVEQLTATVAEAGGSLEQRVAAVASQAAAIVQEAKVEAFSDWTLLNAYLQQIEQTVDAEGADGSLLTLGWVVEQTRKKPALWEFTDDVKAFHSLCVGREQALRALTVAEHELHEYRLEHDLPYAEALREQARLREEKALAVARAEAVEAAARAEAAREEAARVEAERAEALKAQAAREHSTWLVTVHACKTLPKLGEVAVRADTLRGRHKAHWSDDAVRTQAAEALSERLTRIAAEEHEVLAADALPQQYVQSGGAPESDAWRPGVQEVSELTISVALDVVRMIDKLESREAAARTGVLDAGFWTAIQETQRELVKEAAAKAAALAEARALYHEEFLYETEPMDSVSAVNDLTHRVREAQSNKPDYWDDADVGLYAKLQAGALRALLGSPLSPGPLGRPLKTLVDKWSYRNDNHVAHRWSDACKAFPNGEAESIHALLKDGCLMPDAATAFSVLPGITKDTEFWGEVVKARGTDG